MNNLDDEIYVKLDYSRQENQSRNFRLDVELHLPGKGITAVFGESGSGKTTLLRCIAGLEKSALGIVKMKSEVWQEENLFLPTNLRHVGYVFQEPSLFPHLTVQGNMQFGVKSRGQIVDDNDFAENVRLLDLGGLISAYPSKLSGGEKQIISLARELVKNPIVILADEPTGNLDPASSLKVLRLLEVINSEGTAVLMATHNFTLVEDRGYQFMQIKDGEVTL